MEERHSRGGKVLIDRGPCDTLCRARQAGRGWKESQRASPMRGQRYRGMRGRESRAAVATRAAVV